MITIEIQYLGNKIDTQYNGFFNALGKQALRQKFLDEVRSKISDSDTIEQIIDVIKNTKDEYKIITPNTVFIVNIQKENYYISNKFELIPKDSFEQLNFVPYIKFDKSNCDISKEEKRINEIIKYQNIDDVSSFIESYSKSIPKALKDTSDKPTKLYLYLEYSSKVKEYKIDNNK